MDIKQRNLLIGAAAAAFLVGGAGIFVGRTALAPKADHAGETAEQHAAELGAAGGPHDVHSDEHADEVHMDASTVAASGIGLETLVAGSLTAEIDAQGTVRAAPDGEAVLTARASGSITRLLKRLGDPVARGEAVAVVASSEAAALSAALASARSRRELARSTFERERRLFESRITAQQDFEAAQAELNQAETEFTRAEAAARAARVTADGASVMITSPIAGRITFASDLAKLGSYVTPEAVLFRIADPSRIQIEAAVPAAEATRIAPGDTAEIEASGGGKTAAIVRSVTPGVDVASRSATVVLTLSGRLDGLQPGQFVRVHIQPRQAPTGGRFVLPEEAVQSVEGRDVVFVREGDTFTPVPVRVGSRSAGHIEVLSGLVAGQVVAGRNAFLLKAELGKGEAEH
jgi:cobalt-zinc-cadmium efflux system membrane fusion protein